MCGAIPSLPICHYGVHKGTYYRAVGLTRQMQFMTVNHGQKVHKSVFYGKEYI